MRKPHELTDDELREAMKGTWTPELDKELGRRSRVRFPIDAGEDPGKTKKIHDLLDKLTGT